MSSPFGFASNAILDFQVPTGNYLPDEYENLIPEMTTVSICCLLKPATPKSEVTQGVDENSTFFEGFLVDPLELPIAVKPMTKAIARIKTANGVEETGEFTLLKTIQNPFVMSAGVNLVNKIRGSFRTKN